MEQLEKLVKVGLHQIQDGKKRYRAMATWTEGGDFSAKAGDLVKITVTQVTVTEKK